MCLAVPGRVLEHRPSGDGTLWPRSTSAGSSKEVCLQYIPDPQVGEYSIVHVGFALQRLDEESALETLANCSSRSARWTRSSATSWGRAAEQAGVPRPADHDARRRRRR